MFRLADGVWLGAGAVVCGLLKLEPGRSETDMADEVRDIVCGCGLFELYCPGV